ncbi:CoA transferase [Burkholderia aenigmatica]|uniref:CoA transferase n=1 Tax=Burkholderia aenigmatica TaxID=2015348 RepID=A0ABY6XS07_9BURK|nr:CoA transferase [Burkholderia aenigmatica]VWC95134.1 CoA transferase [Burkholderia aenigmatica]
MTAVTLEHAIVLVQDLAPGAAARMGLSFDAPHAKHPRLIVCDISGYGADGPYRDKKASIDSRMPRLSTASVNALAVN